MHHINRHDWLHTPQGEPRGYIQSQKLQELWFHTGTICNLRCPFCLEGSKPGDNRINKLTFADAKPYMEEALGLGVQQFSFTGGEPFVIPEIMEILKYALRHKPCLVLTNGTKPLLQRIEDIEALQQQKFPLSFRISLDYPNPQKHDAGRGQGNFMMALETLGMLANKGFNVSIARQQQATEDKEAVENSFRQFFADVGIHHPIPIISFPDFLTPGSIPQVPYITEHCMTTYKNAHSRAQLMCNYSRMVLKKDGKMCVYACTLVDDDEDYHLATTLKESLDITIMLKHHRCYSCFASGASCSELS
ncbi:radical SAM protein [Candidatus Uabimicrobium amorphum]|uniref:Molybdopterin biosynthesis protein MoeX n=1 Tax=Uabimicrobium amorphum TaxID=2596890 RepID=A0A5S9F5T3_UABAM|nr:radical SAM protein [Candidatus Uabimicrobium amorphum]BBM87187.1 molybdopterin biosynthesis protein MoeX [Candidatus Uabimicrobium amorphum]